jgi:hypothetical protein
LSSIDYKERKNRDRRETRRKMKKKEENNTTRCEIFSNEVIKHFSSSGEHFCKRARKPRQLFLKI